MTGVDKFYAIDFDRCLSDTSKLDKIFYQIVSEHPQLDADGLLKARNVLEDKGISFDQVEALQNLLTKPELDEFFGEFIKRALEQDVLCPGAKDLLNALEEGNIPFGIVSYGHSKWQSIKIRASSVETIPALITEHWRKGEIIAHWQQPDKTFLVPAELSSKNIMAKTVVLLDDKAGAFTGLPSEARGYWVQAVTRSLLPSQDGPIPDNVRIVKGLDQVLTLESL